jgi:hypothetical protein
VKIVARVRDPELSTQITAAASQLDAELILIG